MQNAYRAACPGPDYRDAFEYTLCCVSRDRFTLDGSLPVARYSPFHDYAFQFVFVEQAIAKEVTITLRENVLPTRFFEVRRDDCLVKHQAVAVV